MDGGGCVKDQSFQEASEMGRFDCGGHQITNQIAHDCLHVLFAKAQSLSRPSQEQIYKPPHSIILHISRTKKNRTNKPDRQRSDAAFVSRFQVGLILDTIKIQEKLFLFLTS
jgi:hypothetical protein